MTHAEAVQTLAVERYLLDEMSEIERFAFEDHYFDCVECADDVRAGGTLREGVKAGFLKESTAGGRVIPMPAPATRTSRWRSSVVVPWATAATLALALGYQAMMPRTGPAPAGIHALTPVTLRPDSRGALPAVRVPNDGSPVTLALEVNAPAGQALSYELRNASNAQVAQGRLEAPASGMPLLLLVPSWTLTPSTQYILAVRTAADSQLISEYRFAAEGP
jgi:hypothetical protein